MKQGKFIQEDPAIALHNPLTGGTFMRQYSCPLIRCRRKFLQFWP